MPSIHLGLDRLRCHLGIWLVLLSLLGFACGASAEPASLQSLVQSGKLSLQVVGDGTTTSKVLLRLSNKTQETLAISIPLGQTFVPEDPGKHQYMITTEPREIQVPPGQTVEVPDLPTMCGSPKSIPPPGPESVYRPGDYPDPQRHGEFLEAISTAREFEQAGEFDELPVPRERRASTVMQLAVWMLEGERTGKPEDQISKESIGKDVLERAGVKYESLPPKEQEKFDDGVSKIFAAADLTKKTVQEKRPTPGELIKDPPKGRWFITAVYASDVGLAGNRLNFMRRAKKYVIGKVIDYVINKATGATANRSTGGLFTDLLEKLGVFKTVLIEMQFLDAKGQELDVEYIVLDANIPGHLATISGSKGGGALNHTSWMADKAGPLKGLQQLQQNADRTPNRYGKVKGKVVDFTLLTAPGI